MNMPVSGNREDTAQPWEDHPWREAGTGTPAVPQLPQVFSAGVVSTQFDAAVSACALQLGAYSLNSALQNQIMTLADLLQATHQTPEVPCASGPVPCVEVSPCRLAGKETLQTQRLAAALRSLSDLEGCSSPAGPDFLICEKV